jgi:predicted nuclease of restriction endonuclease-like (RecB) superfamily
LIELYWAIGRGILERQKEEGWGSKIVAQLAGDLRQAFPGMSGFSERNLKYMRSFSEAWPDEAIVQQAVAQIPWGHNLRLLDLLNGEEQRLWYIRKTIENGWSRAVMVHQVETKLYERQGKAISNFETTLPSPQSELANEVLKDPYTFDFLTIAENAKERELHCGLVDQIQKFLLELGQGFAFVGSEYGLKIGGDDFSLDLLFYHLKLRCYVVIDLKVTEFKPEYAGKMNFYLAAVDDLLRHKNDSPSIGLILCKSKNRVIAEYSLKNISTPIGVSEHQITHELPPEIQGQLPSAEELEANLSSKP